MDTNSKTNKNKLYYITAKNIFKEITTNENGLYKINKDMLIEKIASLDNYKIKQILYYAIKEGTNQFDDILRTFSRDNYIKKDSFCKKDFEFPSFEKCMKEAFSWENLINYPQKSYWRQTETKNNEGYHRPFGFKLRISATSLEESNKVFELFNIFMENHKDNEFDFKVPYDRIAFEEINEENHPQKGKFITLYTHTDEQAFELAKELLAIFDKETTLKPFLPGTDISIGNTGKISIAADMDESGHYINHVLNERKNRRDIYNLLKQKALNQSLIYGLSEELNQKKDNEYHFSNRFYDTPSMEIENKLKNLLENESLYEYVEYFNKYNIDTSSLGIHAGKNIESMEDEDTFNYLITIGFKKEDMLKSAFETFDKDTIKDIFKFNYQINIEDVKTLILDFNKKESYQEKIDYMLEGFLKENKNNKKDLEKTNEIKEFIDNIKNEKLKEKNLYEEL